MDIIEKAKAAGLDLMIGGDMVETRLAMGFAGHLATGLGCFRFESLEKREVLAKRLRSHLILEERDALYMKWDVPLVGKQKRMQFVSKLCIEPQDLCKGEC
ncbi:hypothetical protein PIB30_025013 [Stylosanthes scabra]|uniref:NPK1-activating kinesin-like protein C-terminal domain-containing protein n=1 Tax=Stylosanthes scabra TaxID=79078 RepID=A0ABU6Z6R1_9FABA|nr:hypothetical protein [Stylosanthes scabra]